MKKIFNENGNLKLRFKSTRKKQIKEWLADVDYRYAIKFAKEVDCPVFGKALEFPCAIDNSEI